MLASTGETSGGTGERACKVYRTPPPPARRPLSRVSGRRTETVETLWLPLFELGLLLDRLGSSERPSGAAAEVTPEGNEMPELRRVAQ